MTTDAALRAAEALQAVPNVQHVICFDLAPSVGEYAARLQHVGCGGHTGRMTSIVTDGAGREALQQLVALLRGAEAEVPRWLEGMAEAMP